MNHNAAILIEQLVKKDIGGRGLGNINQASDILRAAEELYGGTKILVITGFCIAETMCGETDGPLGAVTLASALEKLGKTVMLVTDSYSENILNACAEHMSIKAERVILPYQGTEEFCSVLLDSFKPSHIVSVERPGKAKDGRFYSMKGDDFTHLIPDSDSLFKFAKLRGVVTIAVGDGGNELGMGKVRELVVKNVNMGETIAAVINADYAIVAGVSNWGAHGLEAMLSILAGRMLLQEAETERTLIKEMVEVGAVDGCTKTKEPTVDGLSLEQNVEMLVNLRKLTYDLIQK